MRISTLTFTTNAQSSMQALETALANTQQQLSTGKRIQSAADDPAGMARVNQYNVELAQSKQYSTNGDAATTNLQLEEQALSDASNTLQSARDLVVQANNSSLTTAQRQDIATQLQQQLQDLVAIANRTDSSGKYLFAGYADGTQPFATSGNSTVYNGSSSVRQLQISSNQSVSQGDPGDAVFMNIPAGNGTFTTAAAATNTGGASIGAGSIVNPSAWVPDNYTLAFSSPTQYTITDSSGNPVASGSYTDGDTISFNGAQVSLSGNPAAGDQFTISPAGQTSAFSTLSNLVTTLKSTTLNMGQLASAINGGLAQIDQAIGHFSTVSASVGSRLNSITNTQSAGTTQQTDLTASISKITDVDYASAVTQLSTEQIALQATQASYATISKLSMFNYLT